MVGSNGWGHLLCPPLRDIFSKGVTGSWLTCCDLARDAAQIQAVPGTSESMCEYKIRRGKNTSVQNEEKTLHTKTSIIIYNKDSHLVMICVHILVWVTVSTWFFSRRCWFDSFLEMSQGGGSIVQRSASFAHHTGLKPTRLPTRGRLPSFFSRKWPELVKETVVLANPMGPTSIRCSFGLIIFPKLFEDMEAQNNKLTSAI